MSADVCKVTSAAPGVNPPMTKPPNVMTTAAAGIVAPAVVITREEPVVAPQIPAKLSTLLLPGVRKGETPVAKKSGG